MRGSNHKHQIYPTSVPVITGSPAVLVRKRSTVGSYVKKAGETGYQTNYEIKCWATWYLLKALTTSAYIQEWVKQKDYLLLWLQMTENSFRKQLAWLKAKKLVAVGKNTRSIRLVSYEEAATVLGLEYKGTYKLPYDPNKFLGKQSFRYFLVMEEFRHHQERQMAAIMHKLGENPTFRKYLIRLLTKEGCDLHRLEADPKYFIERLLQLQIRCFKDGSNTLADAFAVRADTNRGVILIKKHHKYKSAQSVSYLKKQMAKRGILRVTRICVESNRRSRIYVPVDDTSGMKDGYKWIPGAKKTALFLCHQLTALYQVKS